MNHSTQSAEESIDLGEYKFIKKFGLRESKEIPNVYQVLDLSEESYLDLIWRLWEISPISFHNLKKSSALRCGRTASTESKRKRCRHQIQRLEGVTKLHLKHDCKFQSPSQLALLIAKSVRNDVNNQKSFTASYLEFVNRFAKEIKNGSTFDMDSKGLQKLYKQKFESAAKLFSQCWMYKLKKSLVAPVNKADIVIKDKYFYFNYTKGKDRVNPYIFSLGRVCENGDGYIVYVDKSIKAIVISEIGVLPPLEEIFEINTTIVNAGDTKIVQEFIDSGLPYNHPSFELYLSFCKYFITLEGKICQGLDTAFKVFNYFINDEIDMISPDSIQYKEFNNLASVIKSLSDQLTFENGQEHVDGSYKRIEGNFVNAKQLEFLDKYFVDIEVLGYIIKKFRFKTNQDMRGAMQTISDAMNEISSKEYKNHSLFFEISDEEQIFEGDGGKLLELCLMEFPILQLDDLTPTTIDSTNSNEYDEKQHAHLKEMFGDISSMDYASKKSDFAKLYKIINKFVNDHSGVVMQPGENEVVQERTTKRPNENEAQKSRKSAKISRNDEIIS